LLVPFKTHKGREGEMKVRELEVFLKEYPWLKYALIAPAIGKEPDPRDYGSIVIKRANPGWRMFHQVRTKLSYFSTGGWEYTRWGVLFSLSNSEQLYLRHTALSGARYREDELSLRQVMEKVRMLCQEQRENPTFMAVIKRVIAGHKLVEAQPAEITVYLLPRDIGPVPQDGAYFIFLILAFSNSCLVNFRE